MKLIKQTDLTNDFTASHALRTLKDHQQRLELINQQLDDDIAKKKECKQLMKQLNKIIEQTEQFIEMLK